MDFENDIQHGVHLKFGPLPHGLTWSVEFCRWGSWPNAISWQDHVAAQKNFKCKLKDEAVRKFDDNLDRLAYACKSISEMSKSVIEACENGVEIPKSVAGTGDVLADEVRRVPRFMKCKRK